MKQPLLFIAALLIATTPLTAQEWVSFGTPDNVSAGQEFWDNASWDGASCNVGFVLSGVAGSANNPCSNQRPGSWLPYNGPTPTTFLSTNGGPTGFQFGAGNYTFSLLSGQLLGGDIAGYNQDWGYYLQGSGTFVSLNGGMPAGTVDIPETWNLWIELGNGGGRELSSGSQFAIFGFMGPGAMSEATNGNQWIVGIEDLGPNNTDWDYQDVLFGLTWDQPGIPLETVPEPATMTLLATGLMGMAAAKRRRSRS